MIRTPEGFYVYVYYDPLTRVPFYVGKGKGRRAVKHLGSRAGTALSERIAGLRAAGLLPLIEIAAVEGERQAHEAERKLIELLGRVDRGTGTLLNRTAGGQGSSGRTGFRHSDGAKARIGAAHRGKPKSAETKARMSEAGRKRLAEGRCAAWAASRYGRAVSEGERQARSQRAKAQATPERIAAMCERAAAAVRGKPKSPQHREKISAAQAGRSPSISARANMSIGQRRRHAK